MRPYTNNQNLYDRDTKQSIIDLTDDEHTGDIVKIRIDDAIENADDLIDSMIVGHVSCFPFEGDNPKVIEGISTELAIYFLYLRRFASEIPDGILYRHKMALKQLEKIADGKIILCPKEADKPSVKVSAPKAVFTPDTLTGY